MISPDIAHKKAELINHGKIHIPKGLTLPFYPSLSTAGPGAGRRAMVFAFSGTRVKLSLVKDESTVFSLARKPKNGSDSKDQKMENKTRACISGKPYMILKNGIPFLDDVSIEPTLMHAPNQAFINITSECIYNCSFCATPELDIARKGCSIERWIELILAHANNSAMESVAITSGVRSSPHETVLEMVRIIEGIREKLPKIPIGVEPYVTENEDIDLLFEAGATELKINIETPNKDIFDKVCPGMAYEKIYDVLEYAVSVFGKNNVCSNLIVGLGETDEELVSKVEELAKIGVVANLRAVRVNDLNKQKLNESLGYIPKPVAPERLMMLGEKQREILDKYSLSTAHFLTMCHRCKSCDIVPQQDI
ncbi:MAG: radical SAM protein [Candidatus Thorarchaeota archaeon]